MLLVFRTHFSDNPSELFGRNTGDCDDQPLVYSRYQCNCAARDAGNEISSIGREVPANALNGGVLDVSQSAVSAPPLVVSLGCSSCQVYNPSKT